MPKPPRAVRPGLPRLYAIVDAELAASRGIAPDALVGAWLDAGVRLFQLRAKTLGEDDVQRLAERLAAAAGAADAIFVVNDRIEIAKAVGAGVHLGQEDPRPSNARARLGAQAIIGWSTHNEAQILAAAGEPVDYLAIGPVFPTGSKGRPDPVVGLAGVREAARHARAAGRMLVAIGGITLDRAPAVIEAGADAVAVISDLLSGDPAARCRQYLKALQTV